MRIYVLVGQEVRDADAERVGDEAHVETPYGIVRFRRWFKTARGAKMSLARRKSKRAKVPDA